MNSDRTVRTIALLFLMASASAMCIEVGWLARALRFDLIPKAQAVVDQASTTLTHSNAALTSWQAQTASELSETRKATADLHDLIVHTDISLNGRHEGEGILGEIHANIIPHLVAVLDSSNAAVLVASDGIRRVSLSTDVVVEKTGPLVDALRLRVADPQYDAILASAAASMENIKQTTAHGEIISADVQKIADEWVAPIKGFWNHLKLFVFEIAGPAASVASAFK